MDSHPPTVRELPCGGRDQGHHCIENGRCSPGFVFPDQHVAPVDVLTFNPGDAHGGAGSRDAWLEVAAVGVDGSYLPDATGRPNSHRHTTGEASGTRGWG